MRRIQSNEQSNPSRITGIQFSILSEDENLNNSVVEIISKETTTNNKNFVVGGLFDSKMGVSKNGVFCPVDGLGSTDTPGYFGHITLGMPVFYIQFMKVIVKICKCVCHRCAKLLIDKETHSYLIRKSPEERFKFFNDIKIKRCGNRGLFKYYSHMGFNKNK